MVLVVVQCRLISGSLSVLALSSRFDGPTLYMRVDTNVTLSVLALSSRFDGHCRLQKLPRAPHTFSTRSVESF